MSVHILKSGSRWVAEGGLGPAISAQVPAITKSKSQHASSISGSPNTTLPLPHLHHTHPVRKRDMAPTPKPSPGASSRGPAPPVPRSSRPSGSKSTVELVTSLVTGLFSDPVGTVKALLFDRAYFWILAAGLLAFQFAIGLVIIWKIPCMSAATVCCGCCAHVPDTRRHKDRLGRVHAAGGRLPRWREELLQAGRRDRSTSVGRTRFRTTY